MERCELLTDQRLAKKGMVPLRKDRRLYHKHIDDLTPEDRSARLEAERVTIMRIKGRIEQSTDNLPEP
jgi:hypothetical protein